MQDHKTLDNLTKQFNMNAISIESIVEQSPLTDDKTMELERLKGMSHRNEDTEVDKVDE